MVLRHYTMEPSQQSLAFQATDNSKRALTLCHDVQPALIQIKPYGLDVSPIGLDIEPILISIRPHLEVVGPEEANVGPSVIEVTSHISNLF